MLKDLETGRILKTKSEISALQEFLDWLRIAKGVKDGVVLVCHEPTRKVLIPLLLEALYRYNLVRFLNYFNTEIRIPVFEWLKPSITGFVVCLWGENYCGDTHFNYARLFGRIIGPF
jgi:hypothetical protein